METVNIQDNGNEAMSMIVSKEFLEKRAQQQYDDYDIYFL